MKRTTSNWKNASNTDISYFVQHNLFSIIFFFTVAMAINLFEQQTYSLWDILSWDFCKFIALIFGLNVLVGLLARILAHLILYYYFKSQEKTIKPFIDMNTGINAMDFVYFLTTIISSITFAIGLIGLLQIKVFQENTLTTLVGSYIIIKLIIYVIVWAKYG